MKALLYAAGRGERLRPLTDSTPKPLISVAGSTLIEKRIAALRDGGVADIVINLSWLGRLIREHLGDGSQNGVRIEYSDEGPQPLDSGGAIHHARQLLGEQPFIAMNADIWTDFPVHRLVQKKVDTAHLVLVPNPDHNPDGDFALLGQKVQNDGAPRYTYSGIAVYHPKLADKPSGKAFSVVPRLRHAADQGLVSGEVYEGLWFDAGTVSRLETIESVATQRCNRDL